MVAAGFAANRRGRDAGRVWLVVEHFLRKFGHLAGGFAEWCPQNVIQLRRNDREEVVVGLQVVE